MAMAAREVGEVALETVFNKVVLVLLPSPLVVYVCVWDGTFC